ncbi:uncharacterized protein LOC127500029 isoform X48 [Ctenopharyngodon idella]|uniref:uncharacterized protein LOC127500029 isoform X47 n=1 Tax=Ctenopharyngodon idella TaxID=7959 RepID=UPI002230D743|nr:uncharacterized protein LOC127500029 isoform X47 [Ctenopharyngodon idella]XP_051726858.1 uncharacterized protein LOC127500029 isoform X48 [Ctenopharyngodon idella]
MSEKQSERSDSVSVTSDHSKGGGPNFSEETPSAIESERSDLSSSVSVKSDRSKGGGPNFREETPSATERSDSDVSSSVSVKSNRSKDGEGPNFREETPSATERHFISVRSDSDVSSSVSVKSNRSKDGEGPNFREETPSATESVRSVSHVSSSVSVKSDRSKGGGPNFREETPSATESVRSDSDVSSSVSVKSNRSKDGEGPNFREETPSATERHFISLHVSSSVSVKSNRSKDGEGPNFREETPSATERKKSFMKSDHSKGGGPNSSHRKTSSTKRERSGSVESSLVSMRSDRSKDGTLPSFNEKTTSTKSSKEQNTTVNIGAEIVRWESLKVQKGMNSDVELASFLLNRIQYEKKTDFQSYRFKKFRENLIWVFQDLENKIIVFLKNELERFKKILKKENTQYFVQDFIEDMCSIKEAALDITLHFLKIMKQHELADTLKDELVFIHQRQLKSNLKKKYQCVFEGIAKQGDSTLLNSIYTDLYITQGGSEQVNTQHEVRQIEISRRAESQEIQIECTNLFESPEQGKEIRTVLTKGVAGIGKSISVQKFILDWAEEKENQDISFIFPLPFREMNLKEEEKQSLMNLVSQFFPEVKGLNLTRNDKFKVLFILDGLDECRLPLNFKDNETWRDVSSPASLDVLLTNLIRGNLLPSALIWITTRPAAASRIPQDCIDRVTEVRGFNDAQKEEYFNKRFTDKKMAEDIIDHVKKSKSLFIMCHIPVFCWISATVLQNILEEKRNNDVKNNQADDTSETLQESNTEDTPKTLTQMYTHFLRFQIQQSRSKYDGEYTPDVSWDKDAILSLGKLAFHQLERNNLIFYDTDLEACGIDASKALVYSGMCTQIFKEETGIILGTMYCFVHMSIQEFIAALYAHLFLDSNKKNVFDQESTEQRNKNEAMIDLLKTAVDKALTSEIGHLDLFLRFLLGLSLESNHPLLRGLLTQQDSNDQSNKDIVKYIKQKLGENLSPERSINLFYCLNELNEKTLVEDIQTQLREGSLSSADLSPAQWSAVAFVLLTSEKELENFELQEFKKSDECLIRLSAVIKTSKRALLNDCNLTDKSCSALATVLGSDTNLKELNMNNNNLQDSGVALLCTGLKSVKCKLETLWLNKCDLTKESCSALASVLSSDSSSLKDLELSNNNLQDSGVKLLCDGLKNNRKLEKIRLSDCGITEEGYKALASALRSNPLSHLIELDLTGNDPGQSGVKELSNLLQDPDCQLKMSSDSSSLKNLELSNNNLQDSGVKPPCDGLKNNRKLEKIRFLGPDAEEACKYLTEDLHIKNLLLLSELNLSRRELGDTQVNQIAALLKDKHCTLNTLKMNNNSITAEGCAALTSAFNSNPSNLIELDLSGNKLGNSGIEEICPLLENTQCRLMKLKLSDCSITEEGYKSLASALRSNPSHLTELDLTGNDPGQSGVKELNDLLQEEHCKLKSRFLKIPAAQEACEYLTNVLSISPLLLTELDLSEDKLGDLDGEKLSALLKDSHSKVVKIKLNNCEQTEKSCSVLATVLSSKTILKELNLNSSRLLDSGVKEICEGLKNPVCKLEILKLSDCSISEEGYKALASALRSNPSHLIELDLTGNDPGQSGVKELDDLLQDQNCQLKILTFLGPIADEACKYLTEDLHIKNPLLLRELILSGHELGDTRVNQIAALLQDKHCKLYTLMLCNCGLTEESCLALATVLTSNSSLKELDISSNNLQDSGVKKLQNALENTNCTLEKLRLSDCSITEEGYKALASALRSNPSHLIELDLTGNDPGQSGVKELDDLLQDQNCQLKILTFLGPIADEACKYLTEDLHIKNPLLLRELNLSGHELGDTRVNQIAALLQDKHCKLNTLMLCNCGLTEESCLALATVLTSNSSLKELDISSNNLQDSGVKKLQNALENTNCTLEKLRLSDCSITEEGYKALASALRSNPSHLIELDLTGNDPGQSGVKELDDLLQDQNCQLKILTFLGPIADEACKYLTEDLHIKNPLLLRELNLSGHELGDTRVNQIAALLQDKHCKLNTLMLCNCGLTEESCLALATVLTSNSSLKELDISSNNLQDSGVKKLQNALENTNCTLEKLRLSDCSITEEGYKALASALRSNPSHLIELDLTGNDPGQSGVKELDDLLRDQKCQLNTLRFLGRDADEACQFVTGIVVKNPLLLRELNLSERELGDRNVKQIAALLQDKHCTVKTLQMNNNSITAEGCAALTSAFNSNPSNLIELDLSGNKLGNSGMEKICLLLKKTQCKMEKLKLSDCSITEEGYKALASALRSNPSHLTELDLTGNDPGQSGVKELNNLLQDEHCSLKSIKFLKSTAAMEVCEYLTKVLGKSPLLLTELDLSEVKLGDLDGEKFSALLMDSHSKVEKIKLNNCKLTEKSCSVLATVLSSKTILKELNLNNSRLLDSRVKEICEGLKKSTLKILKLSECDLTEESCSALASVLSSDSSYLKDLDLSNNNLQDSVVKLFSDGLKNNCKLEKLRLSDCSITEEGYKALASALRSNPSHLIELDLTGNDPGQSGVKELNDLLQNQNCQLKTLRFLGPAADEACQYLIGIMGKNPLILRELNLSECELKDTRVHQIAALLKDKHCKLNTLILNNSDITAEDCCVLTEALNTNPSNLTELNLSGTKLRDSGMKIFSTLFENEQCRLEKLKIKCISITAEGCAALTSAFNSNPSNLIELDLSGNKLGNSGVTQISTLLGNSECALQILRLSICSITEEGYKALASALRSNPSHLIELDLTGNDPGQSGVKELDDLLQDQNCQLKTLRFLGPEADKACQYIRGIVGENPLLLRALNLSERKLRDTRVNQIAALLKDKHCTVNTLMLNNNSITAEGCVALTSAFNSNPSNLKELDLSGNKLGNSGIEKICHLLENIQCRLEKLKLSDCSISKEGYKALASALRSNPSHLIELDLTGNDPGQSGVKELHDLLHDEHCKLTIRFLKSPAALEACEYLTKVLVKSPLLLTELDLSEDKLGDLDGEKLSALLMDSHSKVEKIKLNNCEQTEKSCSVLATVLSSKTILKELNLNNSRLLDSGVREICEGLKNPVCELEILKLSDCSITEEGYKALASALRSNPSHLIELDLTGNDPGQSGVKELNDLLQNQNCQLKTLRFLGPAADEACQYLIGIMGKNPLILRELNLSECELKDTRVHQIAALLKDKHCKLNTLILNNSDITAEDCCVLTEALNTNPSNLTELNLSGTKLRDSGMKIFSTLFENEQCRLEKLKIKCISITAEGCAALTSAFNSNPSNLIELDLSGNKLGNSGVTQISTLLGNSECALQILRLSICSITEEGYKALASALRSNPSHLIELDLTGNDPGQSGVKELDDLLQDQNCQLKTLRFLGPEADKACQYIRGIVGENPLLLRALNLSERKLRDTRVNQIAALLKDKHCTVNTLMLNNNSITAEGCVALTSAFNSNPSNLKELDLSGNKLRNLGIKKICHLLENIQCRLEKLKLSDCSISKEGYKALASALRSNPSHLIELDLTGNDPGQSGVKELHDLLHDEHCKLTIRFLKSPAALEACEYLTKVLVKSPLLLTELDLSEDKLGDLDGEKLSALLMDSHSKVEKIKLNNCEQTEKSCSVLATVLSSKTILKELNLNNSRLLDSGVREICEGLKNPVCELEILKLSDCSITEEGYKALASALRSNPSHLIELDLTGNDPGQSGVKELDDLLQDPNFQLKTLRLLQSPNAEEACKYLTEDLHIKNLLLLKELNLSEHELGDTRVNQIAALLKDKHCKLNTLMMHNCGLTEESCSALATVLTSNSSLKELDISNNNLQDSGVNKLQNALENTNCTLEKLRLSDCNITEEGYKALASALRSNSSHLIELDLTGNDPGQSGVKELNDLLQDPECQLKTLRFLGTEADKACQYVRGIVGENPLLLRDLNLSGSKLGDTQVNQIAALLQDKHCTVNTLMLNNNSITAEGCAALTSAFNSNPSNLIELDLSGNKLGNSGIKKICHLLKNTQCRLEKLKLSDCSITEEGYKDLVSALRSNPSHLIELDLTGNDPGRSGVKELDDLLQVEHCSLKTIRFLKSPAAQEACEHLTKVLGKSPLLLTELDLSEDKLGDLDGVKLSDLLMDSHSKVEKIKLNNCEQTEKSCSVLATVLSSKTILKELNLNNSRLLDSGVKEICEGLKKSTLKILKLSECSIREEGYKALASALRSNPSHLIELDLTGNDPGQSGVEHLINVQKTLCHSLKTLRILQSPAADEACQYVREILGKNPLFLNELNLSGHKLGDTRVNQIAALLQDKHCTVNTLILRNCGLTEESCSALAAVLRSNSSLKELDISKNNLQNSGVKKLQNGLEHKNCTLEKLRLSECSIREEGYKALASALRSNPSHLIELDLTGNDPGQSGVKELDDLLQDENCELKNLRILRSPTAEEACKYLTELLGKNPLLLRELNLSGCELGDTRVNQIAALLQDKHCQFNTLTLCGCSITENQCNTLTKALFPNLSHLRELDLSGNQLKNTGAKHLSGVLKDSRCQLERLRLRGCDMTDKGCSAVTSALKSNPSHLRELDLSGNEPGDSGFKDLSDLLKNPQCKLENLQLRGCHMTDEGCSAVTSALKSNPSHLRELDLSGNKLGDSGFKNLSDLLKNPQCKLENLQLCKCNIQEKQCISLTSALKSNPSHLRELNLSGNVLRHTRVKHFYDLLKDSRCKLERLRLRSCDITAEDCSAVTSALKSDPSHLRELDLSGNELGDSGVDNLGFVLSSSQCKLEKLHLCSCSITEKQCLILTQHLCYNLSHLRELDFSGNQIENKGVNHLCEVLMNPRCKLERLSLNECGITDVSSLAQSLTNTKALQFLKELDLSKNNIGSSRQQLIDLIKDSSCNLSLEKEGWSSWNTAANVFSGIGGLFTWSKAQEEPVKSTAQEKPPSDERSSEGKLEEGEKQEFLV